MPLFKKKPKVKPWKPATKFTVVKLKRSGPQEGQSTDAYLYGKQLERWSYKSSRGKRPKFKPVQ